MQIHIMLNRCAFWHTCTFSCQHCQCTDIYTPIVSTNKKRTENSSLSCYTHISSECLCCLICQMGGVSFNTFTSGIYAGDQFSFSQKVQKKMQCVNFALSCEILVFCEKCTHAMQVLVTNCHLNMKFCCVVPYYQGGGGTGNT